MEMPTDTPVDAGPGTLDWADPSDLPVHEVHDVFLTLSKALRAHQLYDPNNPVYQRFVSNLREALRRIWSSQDQLQILVEEERLTWLGEEVYRNTSRSDSLATSFYRDGIRDFTFKKGLEEEELERLLGALHRSNHTREDGDDLSTILWDLDLKFLGYSAVDVGLEGVELPGPGEPAPLNASEVLQTELGVQPGSEEDTDRAAEDGADSPASHVETLSRDDFNPTLYALDDSERSYLMIELKKELERDLRGDVLNALFDRLEERERPDRQVEILNILRTLLPNFLFVDGGLLESAARVIEEVHAMRTRGGIFSGDVEELADRLIDDLSAPDAVGELIRGLEDGTMSPDARELSELIRHLRPAALASLLKGSEETRVEKIRKVLREAVHGIADENPDMVITLIGSPDPAVARGAVRLVGRLGLSEASGTLARLLEEGPVEIQRVVLEVAAEVPSSVLAGAVKRRLRDDDRELRVAAARILGKARYAPASTELRQIIESKEFRNADVTEKVAFFEAYGMLAEGGAVTFLDTILNGKSFLGRREPADIRAGAALGLGKVATPEARAALERARNEEDPVIRTAVSRAFKNEDLDGD